MTSSRGSTHVNDVNRFIPPTKLKGWVRLVLAATMLWLFFLPGEIVAQSFSGKVTDACTDEGVPAIVRVSYLSGFPTNFNISTDPNGNFNFVLWSYDPQGQWSVRVIDPQPAIPVNYTISTGSGNSGLNFTVMMVPAIPLKMISCNSSGHLDEINLSPCETVQIGSCNINTLAACWWESDIPSELLDEICLSLTVYESDESCTTLGDVVHTDFWEQLDSRLAGGCGCGTNTKLSNINDYLDPGAYYIVELKYRCCSAPMGLGWRTRRGHIQYVEELLPPVVDFAWNATMQVEVINNDLPVDGIIPRSLTWPGPELGRFSIGMYLYPSMTGGSIETYRILVEEVECSTGEPITEGVIFDKTFEAPNGEMPAQFSFLDITVEVPPGTPAPYFFAMDTEDKCYKATLFASNLCGTTSAYSYFTITEACFFCLTDEGGAETRSDGAASGNMLNGSKEIRILSHGIVPNPASTEAVLNWEQSYPGEAKVHILNAEGRMLWEWKGEPLHTACRLDQLPVSNWPVGMYYYAIKTNHDAAFGRFIIAK